MSDVPEIASETHLKKMINNRDYSVLINYNSPSHSLSSENSNQTFSHDLRLLEIRAVLLSCIYYSAHRAKEFGIHGIKSVLSKVNGLNLEDESIKSMYMDQLNIHLGKLKNLYRELESDPPIPISKSVFGSFFGSKIFGLVKSKTMLAIAINFIELIQAMSPNVKNSACTEDEWTNKLKINATELTNEFEKAIASCQCTISNTINERNSSLKLEGRREVLEILTNMIDVSYIVINNKININFIIIFRH